MAFVYALLLMVEGVPMTPIFPDLVTLTAFLAPGSITPITGISNSFLKFGMDTDDAVLQATTRSLMPFEIRNSALLRE